MRDPATLGNALLLLGHKENKPISTIADQVDRGVLGKLLIHPAFLNGRSAERIEMISLY